MDNKWGPIYWVFLHNFCNKINNDYFINNKIMVINTIKLICTTLPCYTCSQHAKGSLEKYNINNINNKVMLLVHVQLLTIIRFGVIMLDLIKRD